jgi:uncharacterized protein (TIGR00730 family)
MKLKNIAIFGGANVNPDSKLYKEVFHLSQQLGKAGFTIVNGGGPGVMMAATDGAKSVNGDTLTVTFDPKDAPGFEGRYVKNIPNKEIKTHNYVERMFTLMEHGDCYIIFNGGTGTLSELGTAWCLARLYYGNHKPFILYGEFWHEIVDTITKNMIMRPHDFKVFKIVENPMEVITALKQFQEDKFEDNSKAFAC